MTIAEMFNSLVTRREELHVNVSKLTKRNKAQIKKALEDIQVMHDDLAAMLDKATDFELATMYHLRFEHLNDLMVTYCDSNEELEGWIEKVKKAVKKTS